MKLSKGQTVHVGKRKFTGNISNEIVEKLKIPKDANDIEKLKSRDKNYKSKNKDYSKK